MVTFVTRGAARRRKPVIFRGRLVVKVTPAIVRGVDVRVTPAIVRGVVIRETPAIVQGVVIRVTPAIVRGVVIRVTPAIVRGVDVISAGCCYQSDAYHSALSKIFEN